MMKRSLLAGVVVSAAVASGACGLSGTPTGPSSTSSPFVTQFAGMWVGSMRLTNVVGGECVGADLGTRVAAGAQDIGTVTITQQQGDVSAVVRSTTTGLTCQYDGNAALATFSASASSCDEKNIVYQCSNGNARVLEVIGSTMTATIDGNTTSGIVATSYNVFAESEDENKRKPVAGLTLQQQFTAVRR
jgi:hypothetical protein